MKRLLLVITALAALIAMGAQAQPTVKSMVLEAVEDAYVVTDASTQDDPQGIRGQNFGKLDFVRVWYAN